MSEIIIFTTCILGVSLIAFLWLYAIAIVSDINDDMSERWKH